jgi:hypothetical protein
VWEDNDGKKEKKQQDLIVADKIFIIKTRFHIIHKRNGEETFPHPSSSSLNVCGWESIK